ncbi:MAG: STAS domain-containing protein [Desulfovibrionaceae bacterium]
MRGFVLERLGRALLVRCTGPLTIEVVGDLKREMEGHFAVGGFAVLAVDLSDVDFLDSSGIGALVSLNSRAASTGRLFRLLKPSIKVQKTLDLVKLLDFFSFEECEQNLELLD